MPLIAWSLLILPGILCASIRDEPVKSYAGHVVLSVKVENEEQANVLYRLRSEHGIRVDLWKEPRKVHGFAHVAVSPENRSKLEDVLESKKMSHSVIVPDIEKLISEERKSLAVRKVFKSGAEPSTISLDQYHDIDEIDAYVDAVAAKYTQTTTEIVLGTSTQGRKLKALKIGSPSPNGVAKPAAFANGCIHAREWVTCATMLYIINELTANAGNYTNLLNSIDVYILPVANPDGYAYSWATDRMWRKTRSGPYGDHGCYGVDPNRNWDVKWTVGQDDAPCDDLYSGPKPFSDPEPKAIGHFLVNTAKTIGCYIDVHSYSEVLMYPFGYADVYPKNHKQLASMSSKATKAMNKVNGEQFTFGSIYDVMYQASGDSADYAMAVAKIPLAFGIELRPTDESFNGFVLPADQIIPAATETWAGLEILFREVTSIGSKAQTTQ